MYIGKFIYFKSNFNLGDIFMSETIWNEKLDFLWEKIDFCIGVR
jgi:hypothetical protein